MKKNLILVIFLIIILIIIGFIFKNSNTKKGTSETEKPLILNEGLIVADSYETKTMNLDDPYSTFDVKYPYFKNADVSFNANVETFVKNKMDEHVKNSADSWQARYNTQVRGDNIPKVPATTDDKFSFISDFTIIQSNSSYISFVLNYGGFSGGAHGYENKVSFSYDVKNKKVIELEDLFTNNPDYLTYLSEQSREILKKEFATVSEEDRKNSDPEAIKEYVDNIVSMIQEGTEPKAENFSVFTFTPEKIKIYFAQYQVGPYVIGMPTVEVDRE
ncbi:MAG: DUF3298 domain-containing protein [Candidatus Paceibacterota bacterium]|jgi:hypothetical protein